MPWIGSTTYRNQISAHSGAKSYHQLWQPTVTILPTFLYARLFFWVGFHLTSFYIGAQGSAGKFTHAVVIPTCSMTMRTHTHRCVLARIDTYLYVLWSTQRVLQLVGWITQLLGDSTLSPSRREVPKTSHLLANPPQPEANHSTQNFCES